MPADISLWLCHLYCLKLTPEYVCSGASWEGLRCSLMSDTACVWPMTVWSYKAIHSLWLPLLGWVCLGKATLHTKASFHQHQAQGQGSKRPKAPWNPPLPASSCCRLLDPVTERTSGGTPVARDRFSVSHKVGAVVFTRLIQVHTWGQCWVWGHSAKVPAHTKTKCYLLGAYRKPSGWG